MPTNIEIKARSTNHDKVRSLLLERNADCKGTDHQVDTYFRIANGRLKLREANLQTELIHYNRQNQDGPKQSDVTLYKHEPSTNLKVLLEKALGVLVVVDKKREIYFIGNVKFHIDIVKELGTFIEIEAIDVDGSISVDTLHKQCQEYMELFDIKDSELVEVSYSDLLLEKSSTV